MKEEMTQKEQPQFTPEEEEMLKKMVADLKEIAQTLKRTNDTLDRIDQLDKQINEATPCLS